MRLGTAILLLALLATFACNRTPDDAARKTRAPESSVPEVQASETALVNPDDLGIKLYPGAKSAQETTGDNSGEALVSTPVVHLKIEAVKFATPDAADKVLAFYRDALSTYGKVDESPNVVGPLYIHHFSWKASAKQTALTAGPEDNLHMVLVEPKSQGCDFALVLIDRRPPKLGPI